MISINNLTFNYQEQGAFFNGFNMKLEQGTITGLLGTNGAGKTTLLKLMAGVLSPKNGRFKVNDYVPFDRDPNFLEDLFFVPETYSFPPISVGKYVSIKSPFYPQFDQEKLSSLLNQFDIDEKQKLTRLSHGSQKKFLIAFALATNCKLLLLDEPTNGLDIPSKSIFRKVLVSAVCDEQLVIISTHQVKDIDAIIDQLVILNNGKLLMQESMFNISSDYQFQRVASLQDVPDVIYHESYAGGYRVMAPADGEETDVDIELLFNAVLTNQSLKHKSNNYEQAI
ncbi:ABC transporter ATP-binding protein [Puteibacter caeruleilacunae]|nr:ABC transporter ATP-binding protein [Puteibacter caeruleilacunae]